METLTLTQVSPLAEARFGLPMEDLRTVYSNSIQPNHFEAADTGGELESAETLGLGFTRILERIREVRGTERATSITSATALRRIPPAVAILLAAGAGVGIEVGIAAPEPAVAHSIDLFIQSTRSRTNAHEAMCEEEPGWRCPNRAPSNQFGCSVRINLCPTHVSRDPNLPGLVRDFTWEGYRESSSGASQHCTIKNGIFSRDRGYRLYFQTKTCR